MDIRHQASAHLPRVGGDRLPMAMWIFIASSRATQGSLLAHLPAVFGQTFLYLLHMSGLVRLYDVTASWGHGDISTPGWNQS